MTLREIERYLDYDTWANRLLFEAMSGLSESESKADLKSSHHSIFRTLQHIIGAERVWLDRWTGNPTATLKPEELPDHVSELQILADRTTAQMKEFFRNLNDDKLRSGLTIKTSKGTEYTNTYEEMIQHLFNHSTYHRGQIATLLRQLGKVPPTLDLIYFLRNRKT